jgi:acetyl esterase/lipase
MVDLSRREFAALGVAASALSGGWFGAANAASAERDPLWFVDSELRPLARQMQSRRGPGFSDESVKRMHQRPAEPIRALETIPYEKRMIKGAPGQPDVAVFVINAKPGAKRPGILHTHGGGFIIGSAQQGVRDLQLIAAALDCAIVTVDYRLAPETDYRGSTEDSYAGLKWLHDNADEVGIERSRIAVMGESAGGGMAAILAIMARDRGEVPLALQVLIYPMLDDRTGSTRQVPAPVGAVGYSAESNRYCWGAFLGQKAGGSTVPVRAVPGRASSLAGLPPAFIGVGSIDLFVFEDVEHARRLIEAGVPTELLVVPGAFHGFDAAAADTNIARRFTEAKLNALRRGLFPSGDAKG